MAKRIAYLGPQGTFTEDAALLHDKTAQLIPFPSIPAVAVAVVSGMAEEGVVAIENSLEGSVTDTLDLLIHESGVFIRKELERTALKMLSFIKQRRSGNADNLCGFF